MYAVVRTGGKQYRVTEGDVLRVERLTAEQGSAVELDTLLVENDGKITVGAPLVESAKVSATVEEHGRGKKVTVIKFKRRKDYRKKQGHRQDYTQLRIDSISA